MSLLEIFTIIFIHWIADFVMQSDYQAKNKSKSNKALTAHILTYSGVWLLAMFGLFFITGNIYMLVLFPLITFVAHWITDYFTSRLNTKLWSEGKVHWFFVSIGFDQILHYVQLFLTYYLLSNIN